MKKFLFVGVIAVLLASCSRVAPNYIGVLMQNFGKNGKSDFTIVKGRVNTMGPGTELFQVPLWEQRAKFDDTLSLQAADQTEFSCKPSYSYKVIEERAVDVVFQNKQLGSGEDFMKTLEDNILEASIYDILKNESRKYITDTLMATGGSLKFEEEVRLKVKALFAEKGLELITFTAQLVFTDEVREKINQRNTVNTNIGVLDQQLLEQQKKNELAKLQRDYNLILDEGLTDKILMRMFIDKWDGKTPIYGSLPILNKIVK